MVETQDYHMENNKYGLRAEEEPLCSIEIPERALMLGLAIIWQVESCMPFDGMPRLVAIPTISVSIK
jgi:hypothetical protein